MNPPSHTSISNISGTCHPVSCSTPKQMGNKKLKLTEETTKGSNTLIKISE
jgi:hypothetical protein